MKENDINEITRIEIDGFKIKDLTTSKWIKELLPSLWIEDIEININPEESPLNAVENQNDNSDIQIIDAVSEQEEIVDENTLLELGFLMGSDGKWRFNFRKKRAASAVESF